jgi:hypothetical protein
MFINLSNYAVNTKFIRLIIKDPNCYTIVNDYEGYTQFGWFYNTVYRHTIKICKIKDPKDYEIVTKYLSSIDNK